MFAVGVILIACMDMYHGSNQNCTGSLCSASALSKSGIRGFKVSAVGGNSQCLLLLWCRFWNAYPWAYRGQRLHHSIQPQV